jgi:hypothetical protein
LTPRHRALLRLAWFVGLWAAGVLVLAGVGYVLRLVLGM